jgi:thiopurine S-methyltransferase
MEPEFWHQRWQQALIGFHRQDINSHLIRCAAQTKATGAFAVVPAPIIKSLNVN